MAILFMRNLQDAGWKLEFDKWTEFPFWRSQSLPGHERQLCGLSNHCCRSTERQNVNTPKGRGAVFVSSLFTLVPVCVNFLTDKMSNPSDRIEINSQWPQLPLWCTRKHSDRFAGDTRPSFPSIRLVKTVRAQQIKRALNRVFYTLQTGFGRFSIRTAASQFIRDMMRLHLVKGMEVPLPLLLANNPRLE